MIPEEKTPKDIHVTARAIIIHNDHILLAYDPQETPFHYYAVGETFYYLPGGHIEFNEPATDSLKREILEETGYECEIKDFVGLLEHAWSPKDSSIVLCHSHEMNLIFNVVLKGLEELKPIKQQEEHVAMAWVPLSSLDTVDLRPIKIKEMIKTIHESPKFVSQMNS